MDKLSNKSSSKLKKTKLNDLNLTNDLNMNLINNLNNQANGNLPPDIFNLSNLNDLNNSLNQLNSINNFNNANQYDHLLNNHHHLANQLNTNKNAITSEFLTSQSLLYPNFYQQQSKLTLSSNHFISPPAPPQSNSSFIPSAFDFHPFITAAVQNSILNNGLTTNNFFQNHHLNSQQQQQSPHFNTPTTNQQLMMQSLNNLNSLGSLNNLNQFNSNLNSNNLNNGLSGLNNLTAFKDYLNQKPDFNTLNNFLTSDHLNHLNQLNKKLSMLNESFLSNNNITPTTNYQNDHQLINDFTLNETSNKIDQKINKTATSSPSNQIYKQPKRQKLDSTTPTMHNKFQLNDKFNLDLSVFTRKHENFQIDNIKQEQEDEDIKLKSKLKEFEELTKELKVQTNDEHIKLEEKKFSPDSSTEFNLINKKKSPIHHHLNNTNNQSPIVTSTKSSSSEHSSPDIPLNSSLNTLNSLNKEFIKEEVEDEERNEDEELSCNELKIDESKEGLEDHEEKCHRNEINKKENFIKTEDLYNLISTKSFQPIIPSTLKEVSLDRMSFDEEDDDNNSININFGNLIDNEELRDCKDDESINDKKINNRKSKKVKVKDEHSTTNQLNPYVCIRRSERIFFNEVMNTNSNNRLDLDESNKDFKLSIKDLDEPKRILIQVDELLYSGLATKDELTGKFCISLDDIDCSMNNQIFTYDELIRECLSEIKPKSIDQLYEGCRVCAFWSAKTKYLYPGKVVKSYPANSVLSTNNLNSSTSSLNSKKEYILVNFDDGDSSRIALNEIRLLPQDFKLKQTDEITKEENNDNDCDKDNENINNKQIEIDQNDKKVQKLKIKLNSNQLIKKKKKKSHRSKEKHHHRHKHHKRKHSYNENEENNSADTDLNNEYKNNKINYDSDYSDSDLDKKDDDVEWYMKLNDINDLNTKSSIKNKSSTKKNKSSNNELFLPEKQQLWRWYSNPIRTTSKPKKIYYNSIIRDEEIINVNDCAIFQSTGKANLPYVGRIESMWQNSQGNMIVRIKWFYHHEELHAKSKPKLFDCKGALFESSHHYDDNDVQCIKNKCLVLDYNDYLKKKQEIDNNSDYESDDEYVYYLSGVYNPSKKKLESLEKNVPLRN